LIAQLFANHRAKPHPVDARLVPDPSLHDVPTPRVEVPKAKRLKFTGNSAEPDVPRERKENIKRVACNAPLFGHTCRAERAHVMESVTELDGEHAPIPPPGANQLAKRLFAPARTARGTIEFGHTVDDSCDIATEPSFDVLKGNVGVLDDVVQKRRAQRVDIRLEPIDQNASDRKRMRNVWLTGLPQLAVMCSFGDMPRVADTIQAA